MNSKRAIQLDNEEVEQYKKESANNKLPKGRNWTQDKIGLKLLSSKTLALTSKEPDAGRFLLTPTVLCNVSVYYL